MKLISRLSLQHLQMELDICMRWMSCQSDIRAEGRGLSSLKSTVGTIQPCLTHKCEIPKISNISLVLIWIATFIFLTIKPQKGNSFGKRRRNAALSIEPSLNWSGPDKRCYEVNSCLLACKPVGQSSIGLCVRWCVHACLLVYLFVAYEGDTPAEELHVSRYLLIHGVCV